MSDTDEILNEETIKCCTKCGTPKNLALFSRRKASRDGHASQCKECDRNIGAAKRAANPEVFRVRKRTWDRANPEWRKAYIRKYRYGITEEQYATKLAEQDDKCAICRLPSTLGVDHNHGTGAVRGLLCLSCNTSIGLMKEDRSILAAMSAYLLEWEGKS